MSIVLEVYSRPQHKTYPIRFDTEEVALAWIKRHPWELDGVRSDTYLVGEAEEGALTPEEAPVLYDRLYPTCEHGMNGNICSGPNHFGEPGDDRYN